jgi:hypothetical protein
VLAAERLEAEKREAERQAAEAAEKRVEEEKREAEKREAERQAAEAAEKRVEEEKREAEKREVERQAAEAAEKRVEEEKREAEKREVERQAAEVPGAETVQSVKDMGMEGQAEETTGRQQQALGTTGTLPPTPLTPTSAEAPQDVQHMVSAATAATVRAEVGAVMKGLLTQIEHKEGQEHADKARASRALTPVGLVSDEAEVSYGAGVVDVSERADVSEEPTVGEEGRDTGRLSPVGSMVVAPPTPRVETAVETRATAQPVGVFHWVMNKVMGSRSSTRTRSATDKPMLQQPVQFQTDVKADASVEAARMVMGLRVGHEDEMVGDADRLNISPLPSLII